MFCWAEVAARSKLKLRHHLSHRLPTNSLPGVVGNVEGGHSTPRSTSSRSLEPVVKALSVVNLYDSVRIVAAKKKHLQYTASILIAMQPIMLVPNAAFHGREH